MQHCKMRILIKLHPRRSKVSLNGGFMEGFMTLNIIKFANMTRRENDMISWDVRRVSSP